MNKALKALAVLLFAGSVFTCCIADTDDCGCKAEEEEKTEQTEKAPSIVEEETCSECEECE